MEIIMEDNFENKERYDKAVKRVEEIKGFYGNLTAYVVVNIGLLVLNLVTSPEHLWFFWPMIGWGIGVIFHGMKVFNYMPFFGKDWEERKMKEFIEQEKRKKEDWRKFKTVRKWEDSEEDSKIMPMSEIQICDTRWLSKK